MPKRESSGDDESDKDADEEEPAIGGKRDQENGDDRNRDDQACRSCEVESGEEGASGFGIHFAILDGWEAVEGSASSASMKYVFVDCL